jgi:glutamine cyclotransferase
MRCKNGVCVVRRYQASHGSGVQVDVETGAVRRSAKLPNRLFGEGLVRVEDRLLQLTWQEGTLLEYSDVHTFHAANLSDVVSTGALVRRRDTGLSDGWGLTWDGKHLIITDSTPTIRWLDAETLKVVRQAVVMDGDKPVPWVNELEWVNGQVCMHACSGRIAHFCFSHFVLLTLLYLSRATHNPVPPLMFHTL